MQFHIAEPNANLAIGAVWSNHSDSAKLIVLGGCSLWLYLGYGKLKEKGYL